MGFLVRLLRAGALSLVSILVLGALARETGMLDRFFIYFPSRAIMQTPADAGLEYEDVSFTASDGVRLHGWYVPGRNDVTLVWFHGNAGNISHRVDNLALLRERVGVSVFIFDYRGYGLSEGRPSEAGLYLDAEAALEYVRSRPDVGPARLVLFGRSLGAAVAVHVAARQQVGAVILESPFTSVREMARHAYPLIGPVLPPGAVVKARYDTLSEVGDVHAPLLILHGDQDEIVPFRMAQELLDAANEPKGLYAIRGAGHNDTYIVGGEGYFEELRRFIEEASDGRVLDLQTKD